MNGTTLKLMLASLISMGLLVLASCQNSDGTETETFVETADGAAIIDTYDMTATVTAIDPASRKVTLTSADGAKMHVKAGKNVNLDQLKVGDQVSAAVTEELAAFLRPRGAAPSVGEAAAVGVATEGADRAMWMADTVEVTARVTHVDMKHRKVTLQLPDGKSKTLRVGKKVNLSNVKSGDDVTVRITEAVALSVTRS